ncbi:hypothetical protein ACROYT_G016370 [Oculina patagonica]
MASFKKVNFTLLASEWGSKHGGLSTFNRVFAIELAKHPEANVSIFVTRCNQEEIEEALSNNITLVQASRKAAFDEKDWLCFPPEDLQIDIVIGHGVVLGRPAQIIRESRRCKWIQFVHTDPEELGMFKGYSEPIAKGEQKHKKEVELCIMADSVVAVGPKLGEAYRSYLRKKKDQKVFVLTPGIFNEFSSVEQATQDGDRCRVLAFGRGDAEDFELKGFDIAAKAVGKLENANLIFVGAATKRQDEVAVNLKQCDIPPSRLRVRTFLESREELKDLFCEVDLAIMPSRTEGFGLAALEALSAGLPILVGGNSGFGGALSKVAFGSGCVIHSEDPVEWANAIQRVWGKHRETRLEESDALRTSYAKKFSWEKQCNDLVEIAKSIVTDESAPNSKRKASSSGTQDPGAAEIVNTQFDTLREELMECVSTIRQDVEDFKVQVKNDLVVLRQSGQDLLAACQLDRSSDKDDIKKLQAKTDSLTDKLQHSSHQVKDLQAQVTVLETSNTDLLNKIALLEERIIESSLHCEANDSPSTETPYTSEEGTSGHTKHSTGARGDGKNNPVEIVILMDSNRKFLDPAKLSANKKTTILKCGNINSAKSTISESGLKDPQILVFNVGVNDVESTDDATTISNKLTEVIFLTKSQFPTAKIVVSEITPRSDELNGKVEQTNVQLRSALENVENVYVVSHGNIKEKNCFHDAKHLSRTVGIPKLASNIIRGIRLAKGLTSPANKRKAKRQKRDDKRRQPDDGGTPPPSSQPSSHQEDNMNIMREVLQQLQVNASLLSGLASSRQLFQGPGTPGAFPQTIYPFRQSVQAVY